MKGAVVWREEFAVDVSGVLGCAGPKMMRGWMTGPAEPLGPVFYCLAGGGCSAAYFDLQVEGHAGYSMVDHMVDLGAVVVAVDHAGIGASDPVDDNFSITPSALASSHSRVIGQVRAMLGSSGFSSPSGHLADRPLIGVGHSMGGLIATVIQAKHECFDGLVLLGTSGLGLPEVLTEAELAVSGPSLDAIEGQIVSLARRRFDSSVAGDKKKPRGAFFTDDVPKDVVNAFQAQVAAPLLFSCGLASMLPGSCDAERAAITVPIFLAFGDRDLIDAYMESLHQFQSTTDAALYVLANSGHSHNLSTDRALLWDRIVAWTRSVFPAHFGHPGQPGHPGHRPGPR